MKILKKFKKFELTGIEKKSISGGKITCQAENLPGTYSYEPGGTLLEVAIKFAQDYPEAGNFTCWDDAAQ